MSVSRLNESDIDTAMEVARVFATGPADRGKAAAFLASLWNYMLVCQADGKVVGFAYGYQLPRFDRRQNMMYLHQIDVLPEYPQAGSRQAAHDQPHGALQGRGHGQNVPDHQQVQRRSSGPLSECAGVALHDDDVLFTFSV